MRLVKQKQFGEVISYELGYSPVGRPMMTTHLYFVGQILIDTGISHLRKEITQLSENNSIDRIILTHHHEDHSGNAAALKKKFKVPVQGHPLTVEKLKNSFQILPYQHYVWGKSKPLSMELLPETVEWGNYSLKPIHTPGHSRDHTVFWEKNHGWLFSGDLYLADKIKYFRADEKMGDQISSLKKVLKLDFDALFCSHFPKPKNGKQHIKNKLEFLETLYGRIAEHYKKGLSAREIMQQIGLSEITLLKLFCTGNVSVEHMVKSAINSIREADSSKKT